LCRLRAAKTLNRLAFASDIGMLRTMRTIPESDWKKLRSLKTRALNHACAQILDAVVQVLERRNDREHEAYLEFGELIEKQDNLIASEFADFQRSRAF
jgi:hypothetical protein